MIDYKAFWNNRYLQWWHSWAGSYNENGIFKADFINNFIKENNIIDVIEFWCWDWSNLALYKAKHYLWLDVSEKAIEICKEKFKNDFKKEFEVYDPNKDYWKYDLSLSLDVTYHILDRKEWEDYINQVINAWKFAIFYSFPKPNWHAPHINDFAFEEYLKSITEYEKIDLIPPNSQSRFFIIKKC